MEDMSNAVLTTSLSKLNTRTGLKVSTPTLCGDQVIVVYVRAEQRRYILGPAACVIGFLNTH